MKKGILCLLCCVLLIGVTGCGSNEEKVQKETQNIIEEFGIAEGCYSSDNDKEHLICFTNDLAYHDVLYKDGVYYNDPYYNVSPPTEEKKDYYEFTYSDKVLNIGYYSNNELYISNVCYSTGSKVLKCTGVGDDMIVPNGRKEYTLNKVDKEFNKEIIENLPIYERNKEFDLIYNDETIACNLTRSYSILNSMSSLVIKECLQKHYNKEYNVTEMDKTGNWYIYSKDDIPKEMTNSDQEIAYIQSNFTYSVTVNNQKFSYAQAFPIDPYSTNEKMTVKAVKQEKEMDIEKAYKNLKGSCFMQNHVGDELWVEFHLCFNEDLTTAYTWKDRDGSFNYKKHNVTNENGVLQYGNTKVYLNSRGVNLDGESALTGKDKNLVRYGKIENNDLLQDWIKKNG